MCRALTYYPSTHRCGPDSVRTPESVRTQWTQTQNTSLVNYWEASPEKSASVVAPRGPPVRGPHLNVALARLVDLKAALLAEARARGPDGPRMRVPQL